MAVVFRIHHPPEAHRSAPCVGEQDFRRRMSSFSKSVFVNDSESVQSLLMREVLQLLSEIKHHHR